MTVLSWPAALPAAAVATGLMLLGDAVLVRRPSLLERRLVAVLHPDARPPIPWPGAALRSCGAILERVLGRCHEIEQWQVQAGRRADAGALRLTQVIWVSAALVLSGVIAIWGIVFGHLPASLGLAMLLCCGSTGSVAPEVLLRRAARRRIRQVLVDLHVVADLVALALAAGHDPTQALELAARRCPGPLADELSGALWSVGPEGSLSEALSQASHKLRIPALTGLVEGCRPRSTNCPRLGD